jgi:hypothetical protein
MKVFSIMAAVVLSAVVLAGCGGASGGSFASPGTQALPCMQHQPKSPSSGYTDPAKQNTAAGFEVLRYYTANGDRPYCDHKGATKNDKAWAKLYLKLGADPKLVRGVLPR